MLNLLEKSLGNFSLRTKILALSGLFIIGVIVVALLGAGVIYFQDKTIREAVSSSQQRVVTASSVNVAVVSLENSVKDSRDTIIRLHDIAQAVGVLLGPASNSSHQLDSVTHLSSALNGETRGMQQMVKLFKVSN